MFGLRMGGMGRVGSGLTLNQAAANVRAAYSTSPQVWYDPSDLSTLYQDSAGTTPVTAVEQPVGLMLDKSRGLVLGSELRATGTTSLVGSATAATYNTSTGVGTFTRVDASNQSSVVFSGLTSTKTYRIRITNAGAATVAVRSASAVGTVIGAAASGATLTVYASGATSYFIACGDASGSATFTVQSIAELPGLHATQATALSRPVLSSRYNLLLNSEFTGAVAGAPGTAPTSWTNGGTTGEITVPSTGGVRFVTSSTRRTINQTLTLAFSTTYRMRLVVSVEVQNNINQFVYANAVTIATHAYYLNGVSVGQNTAVPVGQHEIWYEVTTNTTAGTTPFAVGAGVQSNVTSAVTFLRADLLVLNQSNIPYQRVTTATDYDADFTKFPPYLRCDGTDDGMATASWDLATCTSDGLARRNLLTNPVGFDDAVWAKTSITVTANTSTAPDGTTTADRILSSASGFALGQPVSVLLGAPTQYVLSFYIKSNTGVDQPFRSLYGSTYQSSTATASWTRVTFTFTSSTFGTVYPVVPTVAGDAVDVLIWGAQLETGSTASAFQNIGTDKVTVVAGVRKESDASATILYELTANYATSNGTFAVFAPGSGGNPDFSFASRGTATSARSSAATPAGTNYVLTHVSDIAADRLAPRVNGVALTPSVADQGAGTYGNYPLYLFRRGGTTLPFNGRFYGLTIIGAAISASDTNVLERFTASKTGITL